MSSPNRRFKSAHRLLRLTLLLAYDASIDRPLKYEKTLNIIQIVFSFCFCFWSDTTRTHIQIIMKRIVLFVILLGEQKY